VKPRGLIIALVISVALNLFLGGLIVGGSVVARRLAELQPPPAAGQRLPLWRAADELPPPKRRAYRQMFRQAAMETREPVLQSRALRRDAIAALESPTYDAEAVVTAMGKARAKDMEARSEVEARIMRFAATLTPEERKVLAAGLRRALAGQLRDPGMPGQGRRGPPPGEAP
jgi:uncharacterized membrane protein